MNLNNLLLILAPLLLIAGAIALAVRNAEAIVYFTTWENWF